jgi:hypothetical protein
MDTVLVNPSIFRPNVIEMPSASLLNARDFAETTHQAPIPPGLKSFDALPTTANAVRLKINSVQIMGGMDAAFLGLGQPKGVYLVSSVVDGTRDQPFTLDGRVYDDIGNNDMLPIGVGVNRDAPFTVYLHEGELPRLLCFSLLVVRSNENLREFGDVTKEVTDDSRFKSLSSIVTTAVSAASPAFGVVWQAANEVIGLVGTYLKSKPDEQLGYYEARYTNRFDDLGAGSHPPKDGGPSIPVGKVRLAYQIDLL